MRRSSLLGIAGAVTLALLIASPQRLVGDGREYLAQAIDFASFHGPALRPRDLDAIRDELARFDPALSTWDIRGATISDARRNRDFPHFWFYALLAAPGIWVTRVLDAPPTLAFTALNVALLAVALATALPRIGVAACLLLFASPVVWWIDKAHTEVFTFALLMIAFLTAEDRPWWSMIAAGAAATQNPPIAVVVLLLCGVMLLRNPRRFLDRRVAAGVLVGVALALLHPVYMYARHQTPSLLLAATRSGLPSLATLTAVITDPSVGLIGNFPMLLIVVAIAACAVALHARGSAMPGVGVAIGAAAIFVWSFSRTTNVHHGGTPSLSRYAIWLIPLTVPLFVVMYRIGEQWWRRFLWAAAITSAAISVVVFRPSVPENSREPTALATLLWTRVPWLNNPIAEVFSETELHTDDLFVPVATQGCEKVLVGGDWPVPCYPAPVPEACQHVNALCYANRGENGYAFAVAPGGASGKLRSEAIWPRDAVAHVRRTYDAWDWRTLDFEARHLTAVRQTGGVAVTAIGSDDRFVLVLRTVNPGAFLRLAPSRPARGILIDAMSGRALTTVDCAAQPGGSCTVDLPADLPILLFAMRYRGE